MVTWPDQQNVALCLVRHQVAWEQVVSYAFAYDFVTLPWRTCPVMLTGDACLSIASIHDLIFCCFPLCSRGTPRKVDTYVWKHSCTGSPCRVLDATAKEKLPATRSSSPWIRRGSIPVTWLKSGLPCPSSMPACCGLSWCLVATSYHNHEMSARAENGKRFKKPTGKWMQFPWTLRYRVRALSVCALVGHCDRPAVAQN